MNTEEKVIYWSAKDIASLQRLYTRAKEVATESTVCMIDNVHKRVQPTNGWLEVLDFVEARSHLTKHDVKRVRLCAVGIRDWELAVICDRAMRNWLPSR